CGTTACWPTVAGRRSYGSAGGCWCRRGGGVPWRGAWGPRAPGGEGPPRVPRVGGGGGGGGGGWRAGRGGGGGRGRAARGPGGKRGGGPARWRSRGGARGAAVAPGRGKGGRRGNAAAPVRAHRRRARGVGRRGGGSGRLPEPAGGRYNTGREEEWRGD